jgi:hypothetical protein
MKERKERKKERKKRKRSNTNSTEAELPFSLLRYRKLEKNA